MSGITLESAYYGDEKAIANITQSLAKQIVGGVLDVTANSDLKPTFEAAIETKLDSRDQKRIREQAVAACGGEADQACLERTRLKLAEERLREKEGEDNSKGVIKGERLTLNVIDNGKRRKLITPAGQKLKLENIVGGKSTNITDVLTVDALQQTTLQITAIIASTFFWVFSVVAVYAIFMRRYKDTGKDYFRMVAYIASGFALLVPGSGYVIMMLAFAIPSFVGEYTADAATNKALSLPVVK